MTPEELETLVLDSKDGNDIRLAFKDMDAKDRTTLSTAAQKLYKQLYIYNDKFPADTSERVKDFVSKNTKADWNNKNHKPSINAGLVVHAVAPLSFLLKRDVYVWGDGADVAYQIIEDRRPEWMSEWVSRELGGDAWNLQFPVVRDWVKKGLIEKPEVQGYYTRFASHLMRTRNHYNRADEYVPPLSQQLLDDPELLADIDGLFRYETDAFNTNSWLTRGAADHYETWTQALVKLAGDGHIARAHLFNLVLEGLRQDFKQNQLAGYHRLYQQLEPTTEELARHQNDYLELLCHPVGHVAKFAIDSLAKLEKQGALDVQPFAREIQTVFSSNGKGNAVAGLKILKSALARQKKKPDPALLDATIEALRHVNADVQGAALAILEAQAAHLSDSQRESIRDMESFVAASNRARLLALAESTGKTAPAKATKTRAAPATTAAAAPTEQFDYQPLTGSITQQTVLSEETRITPIATVDELIDTAFHLVETIDSPDDVERLIDGISRLADQRPADFEARLAPLLRRTETAYSGNGLAGIRIGPSLATLEVVLTWATDKLHRSENYDGNYTLREDAFMPLITHLQQVADEVHARRPRQLLSTPTHKGGWIDPRVWVDRLIARQHESGLSNAMDFHLALLRLAPDNRAEALAKTVALGPQLRRIAGFALGADALPEKADQPWYALWITAARAHDPLKDWSADFAALALQDKLPDSLHPAIHHWTSTNRSGQYDNTRWRHPVMHFAVTIAGEEIPSPPPPSSPLLEDDKPSFLTGVLNSLGLKKAAVITKASVSSILSPTQTKWRELPTAALCHHPEKSENQYYWSSPLNTVWTQHWLFYLWPQNPESAAFKAAAKVAQRMDDNGSSWSPSHGFYNALFQTGRPWGEGMHLLLALGLIAKDADVRSLSVDALIEGIDNRLFDPALYASIMQRLTAGEWVKYNRLADNLMQVIQVSPQHAFVVGQALQAWIPHFDFAQRNSFHLLELLTETQAITGQPLSAPTKTTLQAIKAGGKTGKLAKQLVA